MTDDKVGYGRPPKHSRFKPGVSGNPKGRPKRKPHAVAEIIKNALGAPVQYREQGQTKTAPREEVGLKRLVADAVHGDLAAAATILRVRARCARIGEVGSETIEISNWRRDYPGQTAEQKARDYATANQENSPELHGQPGRLPKQDS
jgi:hypothetical protein